MTATKKTRGYPTKYTKAIAEDICDRIAAGSNLHKLSLMKKFPTRKTMYAWFSAHPEFLSNYLRARQDRADWRADNMDTICDELRKKKIDHQTARILIDNEKWQAGKEKPTTYGDKQSVEHSGEGGGPLVITWQK